MPKSTLGIFGLRIFHIIALCCTVSVAGQTKEHQSLHPVNPSHAPRRQLAHVDQPVYNISLYYAELGYQDRPHHAAIISWYMRYPTVVASDHHGLRSVSCDIDGMHLEFTSESFKLKAEQWEFPLVIVVEGDTGNCALDGPGRERYHPFYAESPIQGDGDQPTTSSFSGFRSRWDVVAYNYNVNVIEVKDFEPEPSGQSAHRRRGLEAAPTTVHISPSLNFDRRENACSIAEVAINIARWPYGSLDMKCRNCFIDSDFQLSINWGSRIINAGINCINKLMQSLYRAEQQLIALAQSAKQTVASQFSKLSERLADLISGFYTRMNDLAFSEDHTEQMELKAELARAISSVEDTSAQLLELTEGQLAIELTSFPTSPRNALLATHELKEVMASTSHELELMIQSGTQLVTGELSLPLCAISQARKDVGYCRTPPKKTSATLTGRLKANFDVGLTLTGSGQVTNGDVTVLAMNLPGLHIPGILSVAPQAKLISRTDLVFTSSANLTVGAEVEWQNIGTEIQIDGQNPQPGQLNNTDFRFRQQRPQFEINPQALSLEQHFKPQVTFGIELLLGAQKFMAGIGADVGLTNTLQLPLPSRNKQHCSRGLKYEFTMTARLETLISASSLARFLISKLLPSMADALSNSPHPLWVSPKLILLEHCFQLSAEIWSLFDWDLARFTIPSHIERISSARI
ncbi:hypothetical protein PSHT_10330 [Puccinia striiformis]|uniref:Uncharacterized protein n=2 Tax=Puccinia striiformis TaxID=27350 RepID=A0A0L0W3J4_9BASI|nr:hypothetical protein Pst134EB_027359 [Puccinia striiformis f. sp. tritici]KAI9626490.1 hypothetical protein KEM48_010314 [Puccinia striiformis f. sp. tritici PST-130]KAI9626648.1 hypothetical protein KEM48_010274 [Puccinia striiformis f. sp. tritici PST-130]KNF06123.1 hypothetical protein PSTG_00631 [Puccinia striiformis f. sp. tritici PST-78]POW06495.1 hypothetical protein PSHT_10330 [Puccinia striiformis]